MINNWRAALFLVAACGGQDPSHDSYQGTIELDDRVLSFELPGRVKELRVARGDTVTAGQVVAALDDQLERENREARAREADAARADLALVRAGTREEDVRAAAAEVRNAKAQEARIRDNVQRQRRLLQENAVPEASVIDVEKQLAAAIAAREGAEERLRALAKGSRPEQIAVAEARLAGAEQQVAVLDERLRRYQLHAPLAGEVQDIHLWPGEIASAGGPVLTIGDVEHPYSDVFVPQADLRGVRVGVQASVKVDSIADSFSGRVEHVSPTTEFTPRYIFSERERPSLVVRVRVRIEDPRHELHPGVPAFVKFQAPKEARR